MINNASKALCVSFILSSCLIVAFGTPAWYNPFCPIVSAVGYSFFWYAVKDITSKTKRFWISLLWFSLVQSVQLSWVASIQYQGRYILIVYVCLILWLGAQGAFLSMLLPTKRSNFTLIWAITSLWVVMEISRLFVFCGFSFNPVGLSLCYSALSSQIISVFGVYGASFFVIAANIFFYFFLLKKCKKSFLVWLCVAGAPYVFGFVHLNYHKVIKSKQRGDSIHVALVQTGLKPDEKLPLTKNSGRFIPLYDQWIRIFSFFKPEMDKNFDYIVLPETTVPFGMKEALYPFKETCAILKEILGDDYHQFLPKRQSPFTFYLEHEWYVSNAFWAQVLSNKFKAEVIIGFDDADQLTKKNYNAAFHFTPYSNEVTRYEKRILVPLAEYLPLALLKPLVAQYGISDHATHGKEAKVFIGKKRVGVSICYEECFGHVMTKTRKNGAEIFVNITNDAWYFPSKLPMQHFMHGKLRSIENGVDLLRACNTGITSVVSSLGENIAVFKKSSSDAQYDSGVLIASFVPYSFETLYAKYGDIGIVLVCGFVMVFFLLRFFFSKNFKKSLRIN